MHSDPGTAAAYVCRPAEEIARRAIVLHCVIAAGHGVSRGDLRYWLLEEDLWVWASPHEQEFLTSSNSSRKEIVNATWQAERQVTLLWAIGKIEELGTLSEECDTGPMVIAIPELAASTKEFIASAKLRDNVIIQAEYEKVYAAHWKARDAVRRKVPIPDSLDLEIIQERHWAFNWVVGYEGQEWDEITTDT